jgi:hypothetical protein
MRSIIYGKYPSFEEVIAVVGELEEEINRK